MKSFNIILIVIVLRKLLNYIIGKILFFIFVLVFIGEFFDFVEWLV